jgi:WD40 repeat protein
VRRAVIFAFAFVDGDVSSLSPHSSHTHKRALFMAPSTESMFLTPVPQRRHAAVLDAGALDVDIQAPSHHAKEPRPSSQTPLKVLEGHTGAVTGLAFFPDGRRLVSSSTDRTLIIWDVSSTGKKVERKLTGHTDRINSVAVTPDGSIIASGSVDGTLRIWDGTSGNQIGKPIAVDQSGPRGVWGVSFSPEGQQIAATRGGRVMIWDLQTRTLVTALETYGECPIRLHFRMTEVVSQRMLEARVFVFGIQSVERSSSIR